MELNFKMKFEDRWILYILILGLVISAFCCGMFFSISFLNNDKNCEITFINGFGNWEDITYELKESIGCEKESMLFYDRDLEKHYCYAKYDCINENCRIKENYLILK